MWADQWPYFIAMFHLRRAPLIEGSKDDIFIPIRKKYLEEVTGKV